MTDIAHVLNGDLLTGDLGYVSGLLESDDSLFTAVLHSLFTDARADENFDMPFGPEDKRGWWGSLLDPPEQDDAYGSSLWQVLGRRTLTRALADDAKYVCERALAWLVEDRHAKAVVVSTDIGSLGGVGVLEIVIYITGLDGGRTVYDFTVNGEGANG